MPALFSKFSALGNDYLVIDPHHSDIELSRELVIRICDRHNGVGSDGILYGPLNGSERGLQIFNPDGSECEKSGNGLRIFADYLCRKGYVEEPDFTIQLRDETIAVRALDPRSGVFRIGMGRATLDYAKHKVGWNAPSLIDEAIEVNGEALRCTFISIGNPHVVVECDAPTRDQALAIGPALSRHKMFPSRVNVQFCRVIDRENIQIEIYERGAGYTLASGSSSCAAVAAMFFQGKVGREVNIQMPGGQLYAEIAPNGEVSLTGQSSFICDGTISNFFLNGQEPRSGR